MSKSRKNNYGGRWADPEDNEHDYYDRRAEDRRKQKQLVNRLRSKNIDGLDDDELDFKDR